MRALLVYGALLLVGCGGAGGNRYTRKQAQATLGTLETPGLVIGEFQLTKVVDGDTIRVNGLDSSLRLLAIDTEETFKHEKEKRLFESGWDNYLKVERGDSKRPVKLATPMGEEAKAWAKGFFDDATELRLERDDPKQIRDRYDRYLAYVFALKKGVWVNYNVECVRAGMAPYFTKYGYSRRFDAEFREAEKEARAAKIGIWDPSKMHDPDYDEREAWWNARGDFVKQFEADAKGKEDTYIDLTDFDAMKRIENAMGKEVVLLATVGDVRRGDRGPTKVMLARKLKGGGDFPIVFFDKDVFDSTGLAEWSGEFVTVRGVVTEYENKYTHRKQLQIVVDRPGQVTLSKVPGLTAPGEEAQ